MKILQELKKTKEELEKVRADEVKLKKENKEKDDELKKLRKEFSKQSKELAEENMMRNQLFENIKKAGGAVSEEKRKEIIYNALQPFFSTAQVKQMLTRKRVKWDFTDIEQAIVLIGLSSKCYRYMRKELHYPLPAVSTVRAYVSKIGVSEGLITAALKMMTARGKTMTELQRIACLTYDEIHLSSDAVYDMAEDRVLGAEDKPRKTQVFMARGVFSPWKNPVYFAHDTPVTEELLDEVITALHHAGFTVVAVTSDLGGDNRGLLTKLKLDEEDPSMLHPVTGTKIYFFADTPHLIKLARNMIMDNGVSLIPDAHPPDRLDVTKEPFEEMIKANLEHEQQTHRILYIHLTCKGSDRQIVHLATELLSDSTASTISKGWHEGTLKSPECKVKSILLKLRQVIKNYFCSNRGQPDTA